MSAVYDNENLGLVYLNKDYKEKTLFVEGVALGKNQVVDNPLSKKNKMQ